MLILIWQKSLQANGIVAISPSSAYNQALISRLMFQASQIKQIMCSFLFNDTFLLKELFEAIQHAKISHADN